jgi:hypothetical protein
MIRMMMNDWPDGKGTNSNDCITKMSSENNNTHHIPELQAKHDSWS